MSYAVIDAIGDLDVANDFARTTIVTLLENIEKNPVEMKVRMPGKKHRRLIYCVSNRVVYACGSIDKCASIITELRVCSPSKVLAASSMLAASFMRTRTTIQSYCCLDRRRSSL